MSIIVAKKGVLLLAITFFLQHQITLAAGSGEDFPGRLEPQNLVVPLSSALGANQEEAIREAQPEAHITLDIYSPPNATVPYQQPPLHFRVQEAEPELGGDRTTTATATAGTSVIPNIWEDPNGEIARRSAHIRMLNSAGVSVSYDAATTNEPLPFYNLLPAMSFRFNAALVKLNELREKLNQINSVLHQPDNKLTANQKFLKTFVRKNLEAFLSKIPATQIRSKQEFPPDVFSELARLSEAVEARSPGVPTVIDMAEERRLCDEHGGHGEISMIETGLLISVGKNFYQLKQILDRLGTLEKKIPIFVARGISKSKKPDSTLVALCEEIFIELDKFIHKGLLLPKLFLETEDPMMKSRLLTKHYGLFLDERVLQDRLILTLIGADVAGAYYNEYLYNVDVFFERNFALTLEALICGRSMDIVLYSHSWKAATPLLLKHIDDFIKGLEGAYRLSVAHYFYGRTSKIKTEQDLNKSPFIQSILSLKSKLEEFRRKILILRQFKAGNLKLAAADFDTLMNAKIKDEEKSELIKRLREGRQAEEQSSNEIKKPKRDKGKKIVQRVLLPEEFTISTKDIIEEDDAETSFGLEATLANINQAANAYPDRGSSIDSATIASEDKDLLGLKDAAPGSSQAANGYFDGVTTSSFGASLEEEAGARSALSLAQLTGEEPCQEENPNEGLQDEIERSMAELDQMILQFRQKKMLQQQQEMAKFLSRVPNKNTEARSSPSLIEAKGRNNINDFKKINKIKQQLKALFNDNSGKVSLKDIENILAQLGGYLTGSGGSKFQVFLGGKFMGSIERGHGNDNDGLVNEGYVERLIGYLQRAAQLGYIPPEVLPKEWN